MDKGSVTPSNWLPFNRLPFNWLRLGALLSCALCPVAWGLLEISGTSETPEAAPSARRFVEQGLAVELEIEPVAGAPSAQDSDEKQGSGEELREGQEVLFRFSLTDTVSGTPLSGVYPAAWMDRKPEIEDPDHRVPTDALATEETCREKVAAFLGGSLLAPPTLDLNVYFVLALNDDASISVVDPLFGFGTTKLLDMVFLDSPGEDWALDRDQATLYVSQPDAGSVAVVSTASWEVEEQVTPGGRPGRLALQPDGAYLWVVYTGLPETAEDGAGDEAGAENGAGETRGVASGVAVIDVARRELVRRIPLGGGPHDLAISDDSRHVFVTRRDAGRLAVIDSRTFEVVHQVPVGKAPASVAWSVTAGAAYVVDAAGAVFAVDPARSEPVARIVVPREEGEETAELGRLFFAPGDRLGFLVDPELDLVHILDTARQRIVQTADVEDGPDQVAFSDHLAYVRHRGSEIVLMIPLEEIGHEGEPVPVVEFPGGQRPFDTGAAPTPAAGMVQAPGATAMLVANPADRAIYFYKEGMAAPMGHFQNYRRQPRAVLAVDRSLQERAPGRYETLATLRQPGRYDVAFFLDSPRTVCCFEVEVLPDPVLQAQRETGKLEIEPLFDAGTTAESALTVGSPQPLRFRLTDPRSGEPVDGLDVQVLTFEGGGRGQRRQRAETRGDGLYEAVFTPEKPGVYYVFVEVPSLGVTSSGRQGWILRVRSLKVQHP